jgi:hypothetical protein
MLKAKGVTVAFQAEKVKEPPTNPHPAQAQIRERATVFEALSAGPPSAPLYLVWFNTLMLNRASRINGS